MRSVTHYKHVVSEALHNAPQQQNNLCSERKHLKLKRLTKVLLTLKSHTKHSASTEGESSSCCAKSMCCALFCFSELHRKYPVRWSGQEMVHKNNISYKTRYLNHFNAQADGDCPLRVPLVQQRLFDQHLLRSCQPRRNDISFFLQIP